MATGDERNAFSKRSSLWRSDASAFFCRSRSANVNSMQASSPISSGLPGDDHPFGGAARDLDARFHLRDGLTQAEGARSPWSAARRPS